MRCAAQLVALSLASVLVCADTKAATAVKTGLPGLSPAKKAKAAGTAANKAAKTGAPAPAPAPYAMFRFKLQQAHCPTATPEDKATLACKSFVLSKQMKTAPEDKKKMLTDAKLKLFQDEGRKSEADKKTATRAAKAFYQKAFAKYCIGPKIQNDALCKNTLMRKMYGTGALKVAGGPAFPGLGAPGKPEPYGTTGLA